MRKLCVILALVSLCTIVEASKKFPLTASSIVPAARGEVVIDKDKNGNVQLNIQVEHLANPQNLSPPAAVYIIWIQEQGGTPQNKGQMKVDKALKGSFETNTPSKSFDLFVTAERDFSAKVPSGQEIFRAAIQP